MKKKKQNYFWINATIISIILIISLFLRNYYNQIPDTLLMPQADSLKYITTAVNFNQHKIYSENFVFDSTTPIEKTNLSIGYPQFLMPFIKKTDTILFQANYGNFSTIANINTFLTIRKFQALLSTFSVLLIFLISRQFFSFNQSLFPTILTAINPHLIMMNSYILTETLYIFLLSIGLLLFIIAEKKSKMIVFVLSGILLAASFEVRLIGAVIPISLIIYLILLSKNKLKKIIVFSIGILIILLVEFVFLNFYLDQKANYKINNSSQNIIEKIIPNVQNIFTPTDYFIEKLKSKEQVDFTSKKKPTNKTFFQETWPYIAWNLGGKAISMWTITSPYTQQIYIYPNDDDPFNNPQYSSIEKIFKISKIIHWPLYLLSFLGIILSLSKRFQEKIFDKNDKTFLMVVLSFLSFYFTLYIISAWLPRYTIPLRPFSYIFALLPIILIIKSKKFFQNKK